MSVERRVAFHSRVDGMAAAARPGGGGVGVDRAKIEYPACGFKKAVVGRVRKVFDEIIS